MGRPPAAHVRVATGVLTALSLVPDVTFGFDAASAVVLIVTHLAAAAIVIPALAQHLAR